jgi:predicted DNA-binding transcriptional regulator YafY
MKSGDHMQVSRLFEIVILLLDKKTATAAELARHFSVSQRTIYRDVEALSQAGIPVYASQGKNGGISLVESFVIQKSLLNKEEQTEILAALQGLKAVGITRGESLLAKWRALFGAGDGDWVSVDFSDWSQTKQSELALLKDAILNKKVLSFSYYGASGEKTEREAEPLSLWFKSRAWYLKAFCRLRQEVRLFKLTRMKNVRLSGDTFLTPKQTEMPPVFDNNPLKPFVVLKILIDGSQAFRVFDDFDESQIDRQEDGCFLVTAAYPEDEWVYGFLMSYGPYLKVLEPAHIQGIFRDRLEKMASYY